MDAVRTRRLGPGEAAAEVGALADILIDCVDGGASVSFMAPLSRDTAEAFWRGVAGKVAAGTTALLVAEAGGRLVGTVQLVAAGPENQPHRADVAKMLVRTAARRQGIGRRLMTAVEAEARATGRLLLVLDTVTGGDAERLYAGLGWTRVGIVPDYALFPDGRLCDTTIFFKRVAPVAGGKDPGAPPAR